MKSILTLSSKQDFNAIKSIRTARFKALAADQNIAHLCFKHVDSKAVIDEREIEVLLFSTALNKEM